MLVWACDSSGCLHRAEQSFKQTDYYCPECRAPVRLRSGPIQQAHFYHYQSNSCRYHGVGPEHLACQQWLIDQLIPFSYKEQFFCSIKRQADLFVPSEGLILEVQWSPISTQEVIERVWDYQQLGLEVIWVLDERRFSSTWQEELAHIPHYFAPMGYEPLVLIDRLDQQERRFDPRTLWRKLSGWRWPKRLDERAHLLWQRSCRWRCGLEGDWLSLLATGNG